MRVAQSEAAGKLGVAPEEISPAKFFPRVAVACYLYALEQQWARDLHRRHPRAHFRLARPHRRWACVSLAPIHIDVALNTASTTGSVPRGAPGSPLLMCAVP